MLDPAERRRALLGLIRAARRRLVLSLFRCDDADVLDGLASALARGVEVRALLTNRAKGGRRRLLELWDVLERMGARVAWYADPVVKYHAKYLVADEGPAMVATLNPTRKCFTRTWDAALITHDRLVVASLLRLHDADAGGRPAFHRGFSPRLIVGPERARAGVTAFLLEARRRIRILDHKLADPEVVALLRAQQDAGVEVAVLGSLPGKVQPHGRLVIVDDARALVGSLALSTESLDMRREVAVTVDDPAVIGALVAAHQALWDEAAAGTGRRADGWR